MTERLNNAFSINKAFEFFDKDKNGQISKDELQTVLESSGINRVETDMIKDILLECDINGDGIIDKDEFFRWMSYKRNQLSNQM